MWTPARTWMEARRATARSRPAPAVPSRPASSAPWAASVWAGRHARRPGPEAAPAATGGTITPGLYFLTAVNVYGTSTTTETYQITMNLSSSGSFWINPYDYGFQASQSAGTYSASGNMFSRTDSCPGVAPAYAHPYTATATTLALFESGGLPTGTVELVYTVQ